jgi:hypothetical protein
MLAVLLPGAPVWGGESPSAGEDARPVLFYTFLSPDEETSSPGSGRADFSLDRKTLRLSWKVSYGHLTSSLTSAAVHGPQRLGTNAGVQIDLAPGSRSSPLVGSSVLTDAQLEYLLAGRMYVNLHTTRYPDGELRGQIQRVPPGGAPATPPSQGPS